MNKKKVFLSYFLAFVMASTALALLVAPSNAISSSSELVTQSTQVPAHYIIGPLVKVTNFAKGCSIPQIQQIGSDNAYNGSVDVMIGLNPSNETALQQFLSGISNPSSPLYHHYLTKDQFDTYFGASSSTYTELTDYLKANGAKDITQYSDRMELSFSATSSQIRAIFNVTLQKYNNSLGSYFAPSGIPYLPASIVPEISGIAGLSNFSMLVNEHSPLSLKLSQAISSLESNVTSQGYPIPVNSTTAQYLYGSEMQIAMDENTLFSQFGYPTNMVEATILWSGEYTGTTRQITSTGGLLSPDTYVGPFVPSDIYAYYNETLPSGEPHSKLYAYPIFGAPLPGITASYDSTGANVENTLDLEMLGSTAPGSSIYNVYGSNSSTVNLLAAFSSILNPIPSYSALDNVSVISNSWGGTDGNSTQWYNDLQEANARGITVLAASGDDADSTTSSEYIGSNVSFPASMAYNNFGMVAVGGVSITLNNSLEITSETNWYEPASTLSTAVGTTSGISTTFAEPNWQINSSANQVIQGMGRGVPDISALANNTIMTITLSGVTYYASNASEGYPFEAVAGTSIASPIFGGVVSEIDHVLESQGTLRLGFLDPSLYKIGTAEYNPLTFAQGVEHYGSNAYNTSLSSRPFRPVIIGQNTLYTDTYGYSLLNGWGTINAYNFTSFVVNDNFTGAAGLLSGVSDILNISRINGSSYLPDGTLFSSFNASFQQNFFLSSSLGTPAFWVQATLQVSGVNESGFDANFSLLVETPFTGLYPDLGRYEYVSTPVYIPWNSDFNLTSVLATATNYLGSNIRASVGVTALSLPVPGAAYIIGKLNYNYFSSGTVVSTGPNGETGSAGTFSPQFLITGALSAKAGVFGPGTNGSVIPMLLPFGSTQWVSPKSNVIDLNGVLAGPIGANIAYSPSGNGKWMFGFSGQSLQQGISYYVKGNYVVTFNETGLPAGTMWHVNIQGLLPSPSIQTNGTFSANVTDGPYHYGAYASNLIYAPTNNGTFVIDGANISITIHFEKKLYTVSFIETGLPANVSWSLNVSGVLNTGPTVEKVVIINVTNGTYNYRFSSSNNIYAAAQLYGTFNVNGSAMSIPIEFFKLKYSVSISESGLPAGLNWTIIFNGVRYNLSSIPLLLTLTNGSYNFTVFSVPGYMASQPSGTFVVSGSAAYLVITFTSPKTLYYDIEFVLAIIAMVAFASLIFYLLVRKRN